MLLSFFFLPLEVIIMELQQSSVSSPQAQLKSQHAVSLRLYSKYTSKVLKLIGALTNSVKVLTFHFIEAYPCGNKLQRMMPMIISEETLNFCDGRSVKNGRVILHDFTMNMSNL